MLRDVEPAVHGGDVSAVARRYGIREGGLLDFSANLNPLGPPRALVCALVRGAKDRSALMRYPDDAHAGLVSALATLHGIDPATIVVGNGSAALLDAAVRVRRIERCLLPEPAFSEDRRALASAAVDVVSLLLRPEVGFALEVGDAIAQLDRSACDALLITNPHNPSGALVPQADIVALARAAHDRGALTIVDEAFVDYAPQASVLVHAAEGAGMIVVRSLTKLFAAPALRAGYLVCSPDLARRLRAILPPWPVSSLAAAAFAAALDDRAYVRRTLRCVADERHFLKQRFTALGFGVPDSAANYLLLHLPRQMPGAAHLVEELARRERIVVRDCTNYKGLEAGRFVRVAVRRRRENLRLSRALARYSAEYSKHGDTE